MWPAGRRGRSWGSDEPNDPELEAKVKRILLRMLGSLLRAEGFALEPPTETT